MHKKGMDCLGVVVHACTYQRGISILICFVQIDKGAEEDYNLGKAI